MKLREKAWLWGLDPGADHFGGENGLAGSNRMTPVEGSYYFGTRNLLRISRFGFPKPPLDNEAEKLSVLERTVWAVDPTDPDSVDELIRIAKYYPHIKGAIIVADGFEKWHHHADPALYRAARERMKAELGQDFQLWLQIAASQIVVPEQFPYMECADVLCIWMRSPAEFIHMDTYLGQLTTCGFGDKKVAWGVFFWDFTKKQIMNAALVTAELEHCRSWLREGKIEGIVLYSNTLADTNLAAAFAARDWMTAHGDEELPGGDKA